MDIIKEMTQVLSLEEKKDFRLFLQRYQKKKPDKTLELFQYFSENKKIDRSAVLAKLYPKDSNLVAYHATRKRLIKQLSEYIFLQQKKEDLSSEGQIESLLFVSKYLFDRNAEEAGWNFLKQAEELALKTETYLLLNTIYSFQIEKSLSEFAPELSTLLKNKKQIFELAQEEDRANTAQQIIRHKLMQSMAKGDEIDMGEIVSEVLSAYQLNNTLLERPRLMYNIISIMRSIALSKKDFYSFEPYIIKQFTKAEKKNIFNQYNHRYKVHILYMIAHVLYRNKKFIEAEHFLKLLSFSLQEFNNSQYLNFQSKYMLLNAAVLNYTGRNTEAIDCLRSILDNKTFHGDKINMFNAYLNLSIYLFQQEQFHSSAIVFRNLLHSDNWLSKIMGREWVMKKNIMECISQFELGNSDIVDNRLKSILRNFNDLFHQDTYKRVYVFLLLVKRLNDQPNTATSKEFKEEVRESFFFIEVEKEDIQAMSFYGWLKAKVESRSYYEVLLELVNYNNK